MYASIATHRRVVPKMTSVVVLTLALALGGCAVVQNDAEQASSATAPTQESDLYMGSTWMDQRGVIFVKLDDAPPEGSPTVYQPGSPGYDDRIEHAQGLKPGERKRLPRVVGWVQMNADGSLTVTKILRHPSTSTVFPMVTVQPSEEKYKHYLSLIPTIKPGQTRLVLATVVAEPFTLTAQPGPSLSPEDGVPLLCQQSLPYVSGRIIGWVNILTDAAHKPIDVHLMLRTNEIEAVWALNHPLLPAPGKLREFSYGVNLPLGVTYPLTAEVTSAGRRVWSRSYSGPSGSSVTYTPLPADPATGEARYVLGPEIGRLDLLNPKDGPVPDVRKLSRATVRVLDGTRRLVHTEPLQLPNWGWVQRQSYRALRKAETDRKQKSCGPSVT